MSFNGGMEDIQNWAFSVRYTASPYRKAFNGNGTTGRENSSVPGPNHNFNSRYNNANNLSMATPMMSSLRPSLLNSNPIGLGNPIPHYNPNIGHEFNFRPVVDNQYHYHPPDHPAMQGNLYYNSQKQYFVPDHHHYGLPLPLPSPQNAPNGQFFIKPTQFSQEFPFSPEKGPTNFAVNGVLDEGYIEDLKQTNCNTMPTLGNGNEFVGRSDGVGNNAKQLEYDPYSYVYDSKIQEDMSGSQVIQRHQPELVPGIPTTPLNTPSHGFNAFGGDKSNSRSASGSSENEYEEIRDVARYINQGPQGPYHFKSFSSTDDILAEVVQVQQRHDRVLDQLNLEVENLLIRSTTEIEERSKSYENELGKLSDLRQLPTRLNYIPKTAVKAPSDSHCFCNDHKLKSLSQSGDLNNFCRSDVIRNRCGCVDELSGSHTLPHSCKSESDHLKSHQCNLTRNNIPQHDHFQSTGKPNGSVFQNNSANVSTTFPTNTSTYNSISSASRKKKLDRSLTTDTNFKSSIATETCL